MREIDPIVLAAVRKYNSEGLKEFANKQTIQSWQLNQLQSISLDGQIQRSLRKITEWYYKWDGKVYVSISGRDSAVLLHLVRSLFPDVVGVYCNTGLEHPEVREYIETLDNIIWIKPELTFKQVLEKYGWPIVSKEVSQKINEVRTTKSEKLRNYRMNGADNKYKSGKIPEKWKFLIKAPFKISDKCCEVMKKRPFKKFEKKTGLRPIIGTMADDSKFRRQSFLKYTCNAFGLKRPCSRPLSTWLHAHILEYVERLGLLIPACYAWVDHTGCLYCGFGVHLEPEPNRFQAMSVHQPVLHNYIINKIGMGVVLDFIGVPYRMKKTYKEGELALEDSPQLPTERPE